jgi:glycosyltransferase involved in cell wall biosynthesis
MASALERDVPTEQPRVSFGLFVYNAENSIRRCIDSILAQDFPDFELVVCDNASTDGTRAILQEYEARDPRVRVFVNEKNVGLLENANRVFHHSRGEFYRWVGADDWFEPTYASRCVAALDSAPEAIAATTYFRTYVDGEDVRYEEYQGERVESARPELRFSRMLWFLHQSDQWYDPLYSLYRRNVLAGTALIRMMNNSDLMLAAELSLIGPYTHVPECLYNRTRAYRELARRKDLWRRFHPTRYREMPASPWRLFRVLLSIIRERPLDLRQRAICFWAAVVFSLRQTRRHYLRSINHFRRHTLGIRRDTIPFLRRFLRQPDD